MPKTPCNKDFHLVGPHAQTMYLGCSVVNFNITLGWGGESSSCNVKLAQDYSAHHHSSNFSPQANFRDNINNRLSAKKTDDPRVTQSEAFNDEDIQKQDKTSQSLFTNIHKKNKDKYDHIAKDDKTGNVQLQDIGKKCWNSMNYNANPLNWTDPDPGFIGNKSFYSGDVDYDIIGCLSFFKFSDVFFAGVIKNWKYQSSEYQVQLGGLASVLKNCKMILKKYRGSVSSVIPGTAGWPNSNGYNLAVPSNAVEQPGVFGTIQQGAIPNLFNIFGWMETNIGLGASGYSDEKGVQAAFVYDTLKTFLGGNAPNPGPWSPFGAIVVKSPFDRTNGQIINPAFTTFTTDTTLTGRPTIDASSVAFTSLGLIKTVVATDGINRTLLKLDLSNVPRPPLGAYINDDSMDLISFIDYCCSNAGYDFFVDFLPDSANSPFSGTITIKTVTRRVQPMPNIIKDFILGNLRDNAALTDFNFGEEFNDVKTRKMIIGGKQQRLYQAVTSTFSTLQHRAVWDPTTNTFAPTNYDNQNLVNSANNNYREPDPNTQRIFENIRFRHLNAGAVVAQTRSDGVSNQQYASINKGTYFNTAFPNLGGSSGGAYPLYKEMISPYFGYGNNGEPRNCYYDRGGAEMLVCVDFQDIASIFPIPFGKTLNSDQGFGAHADWIASLYSDVQQDLIGGKNFAERRPSGQDNIGYGKFTIGECELSYALDGFEQWEAWLAVSAYYGKPVASAKILWDFTNRNYGKNIANVLLLGIGDDEKIDGLQNALAIQAAMLSHEFQTRLYPFSGSMMRRNELTAFNLAGFQAHNQGLISMKKNLYDFVKKLAETYYGRTFAVRVPQIVAWNDGTGKLQYSYEITDSAWEEPGNMIDNTMMVGSNASLKFSDSNGKIQPILGFRNDAEIATPILNMDNLNMSPRQNASHYYDPIAVQHRYDHMFGLNSFSALTNLYAPLEHQLPEDSWMTLPYTNYFMNNFVAPDWNLEANIVGMNPLYSQARTSAYGYTVPVNTQFRTYVKASIEGENPKNIQNPAIIYDNGVAKVVLSTPSPVYIRTLPDQGYGLLLRKYVFGEQVPAEIGSRTFADDWTLFEARTGFVSQVLRHDARAMYAGGGIAGFDEGAPGLRRAATPYFAAIPIQYNLATYGPWVSHPGIIAQTIFPNNINHANTLVNNLMGGIDVSVNENFVPWNYNGMNNLDTAAMNAVADDNNFQQVLEAGSITLAGIMFNNSLVGQQLLSGPGAPLLTNVSVSVQPDGINTTYELKTFSRKIGFYNKEISDNVLANARQFLQTRQAITQATKAAIAKISVANPNSNRIGRRF